MIEETGVVVQIDGDSAWVETQRQGTCGHCSARKGCGTGILGEYFNRESPVLQVRNTKGVAVGDRVVLGMSENGLLTSSVVAYLVPLLALIVLAIFGRYVANLFGTDLSEFLSIVFGVAGFAAGIWWLRRFSRRVKADSRFHPVLLKKI